MRKSISCRASTASEAKRSGATRFCTARVRSLYTSAEKRARLITNRGFAARQTSNTCGAHTEHQADAPCQNSCCCRPLRPSGFGGLRAVHRAGSCC